MFLVEPAVTKTSAEDDGLVLNVEGPGDQEVSKPGNGEHQASALREEATAGGNAEQIEEPCATSSSESHPQVTMEKPAKLILKALELQDFTCFLPKESPL